MKQELAWDRRSRTSWISLPDGKFSIFKENAGKFSLIVRDEPICHAHMRKTYKLLETDSVAKARKAAAGYQTWKRTPDLPEWTLGYVTLQGKEPGHLYDTSAADEHGRVWLVFRDFLDALQFNNATDAIELGIELYERHG